MKRVVLAVGAAAVALVPAGTAWATEVHTPRAGRAGCGVEAGTIAILEPGSPTVTFDGFQVDISHCLPPISWQ